MKNISICLIFSFLLILLSGCSRERPAKRNARSNTELLPSTINERSRNCQSRNRPLRPTLIASLAKDNTVYIQVEDEYGNAFAFGSGVILTKGVVATNFHVMEGAFSAVASLVKDTDRTFDVEGYYGVDELNDIAIISVPNLDSRRKLCFEDTPVKEGEEVFAAGNPSGLTGTISDGMVSAIRVLDGSRNVIQITAPVSPGSSGGPVLNAKGNIIGLAVGTMVKGQNLNFVIPGKLVEVLYSRSIGNEVRRYQKIR